MADNVSSELLKDIHRIAEHVSAVAPTRKVSTHEYIQERQKGRPKLERTVYMSGAKLPEKYLSAEEIALLNKVQAGKYNGGRWSVLERDSGGNRIIDIIVPNATQEDRMRLMGEAPNLTTLLKAMLAERPVVKAA